MPWSWSPLLLTMGVQIPRSRLTCRGLEVWILRTTLVSILASTLMVTTCRASPILAQPQPHHESHLTVLDSTNLATKGLFDDYHSHQDVPAVVGELHEVDPPHLHHRGFGLRKKASQLSLAIDRMTLIGFAYTEALIGKQFDSKLIRLNSLTLPARRPTHPSTEYLYLIPKLGIESQNPKCPVYARKSLMKENIPEMVYESHGEPPVYTATSDTESDGPAPPYSATARNARTTSTAISKRETDRGRVIFFKDQDQSTVIMRLPREEFTQKWGLKGECYRTANGLPRSAADQWNAWKKNIQGWPSFIDLVD
ncbi:hypothetical protein F5050DRAFT_1810664 [Lentinula boryana]|uniref:Uncharacterized protein n=1 Tax=Lentinula boryana TaxID=40481 RepID=A0ABQ8Q4A5_9AGAR|nr:hypothetical protein F5050DRAFT_1810664 [Lentinula boryana]